MGREYDPERLELEKNLGTRPILAGSPEEIIEQYNGLGAMLASQMPPPDPSVTTTDETADDIPIRIYRPKESHVDGKKLPVGVYTHGGGFICGSLDAEDPVCRAVAQHTPCIIVSVDYRLGPKYKMPTMLDDSLAAYKWAWKNAESYGGDQSNVFTIGGSAGGSLALEVANAIVENPAVRSHIQGVVAILHGVRGEQDERAIIDAASMQTFYGAVNVNPSDPKTFTALSKNLAHFPPTYIATCEFDPLRDDGIIMMDLLTKAGVKTKHDHYPGFGHYLWIFPSVSAGQRFMGNLIEGVKFVLSANQR